jgi:phosphoenolpyruvate carboxykinase (ATP)
MLNFQYINEYYASMYRNSKVLPDEGDVFIFSDPDWRHPEHPLGLAFFDPEHNIAAILGMRYFGEHKKGTLTLVWGIANRNGYASCHGGLKRYNMDDRKYVVAVFGLSGSGKSTITHAKHGNKYDVTILHDDAFIINDKDASSIALEPTYFDKTQDYPMGSEDNKYILTAQNTGAALDENGNIVLVTEDIRNGNGRAIKSRLWSPNRVDRIDEKADAIFWLMKDPTLPPVVKMKGAALASTMGATLATKRTTAERLAEGVDPDALVVEPYANPFRTYPLSDDYYKFKALFETGVDCYILNTGAFMGKDITPAVTLGIIESIIEGKADFKQWANFSDMEILEIEGYIPDFTDEEYRKQFTARMKDRLEFIKSRETEKGGYDKLPAEALEVIEKVISEI